MLRGAWWQIRYQQCPGVCKANQTAGTPWEPGQGSEREREGRKEELGKLEMASCCSMAVVQSDCGVAMPNPRVGIPQSLSLEKTSRMEGSL